MDPLCCSDISADCDAIKSSVLNELEEDRGDAQKEKQKESSSRLKHHTRLSPADTAHGPIFPA